MTQAVALAQQASTGVSQGFKNKIINGAMVIDQRNAGASVSITTDGMYTLDRWAAYRSQSGKYSVQQNAGSVTPPSGFTNYLGCTVGASANVTVGSTDYFTIRQPIEGFNVSDLDFGKATAKTVTLSFWVRSSLIGTYGGVLANSAYSRCYPFTYSISVANTWEQKSVTIAGDTTGTWLTTNGVGLYLEIALGVGSTYSATAGAWTSSGVDSATGAIKWIETNGATFYITGVQLEVGSSATGFDYRPIGTEFNLCQRYFEIACSTGYNNGLVCSNFNAADTYANVRFVVTKRATPTVTVASPANSWNLYGNGSLSYVVTAIQSQNPSNATFQLKVSTSNQLNQGGASHLDFNTVTVANSGGWNASAEL